MKLAIRKRGNINVLELTGKLDIESTGTLRREFRQLLEGGERLFILDLHRVPWLDSSGIGEVVACFKRAREKGAVLKVALRGRAHDLFTMCELGGIIDLYEDIEDALASFASPPAAST